MEKNKIPVRRVVLSALLFCLVLVSIYWTLNYGEKLEVSNDTFNEWFTGKIVMVSLTTIVLFLFVGSLLPNKKEEEKPKLATPKKYVRRR